MIVQLYILITVKEPQHFAWINCTTTFYSLVVKVWFYPVFYRMTYSYIVIWWRHNGKTRMTMQGKVYSKFRTLAIVEMLIIQLK